MTNAFQGITISPPTATVAPGDSIAASTFYTMLSSCNLLAGHVHQWTDDYTLLGTGGGGGGGGGIQSGAALNASQNRLAASGSVTATAISGLTSDGRTFTQSGNIVTYHSNWYAPTTAGIIHSYWFRTTVTSGALTSGTGGVGTWQQLGTSSNWDVGCSVTVSGNNSGNTFATGHIDIATDSAGSNIVATWTFSVSADVSP